jgi:hypothetical protein
MKKDRNNMDDKGISVRLSAVKRQLELQYSFDSEEWEELRQSLGERWGDTSVLPLEHILDTGGLDNALKALSAVKDSREAARLFACRCAGVALHFLEQRYPEETRPRAAVDTAARYALGKATPEELLAAGTEFKEFFKALLKDPGVGNYLMEELYDSLNTVAACVDLSPHTYRREKFKPDRVAGSFYDAARSMRWFLKNVLCVEDASANAALEATDPVQAVFSASYSIPALRRFGKTVAALSREAVRTLADDAAATLAANSIRVPRREALEDAAVGAIWNAICKGSIRHLTHIGWDAAIEDLTAEFRRLCRLEGEYGETMRA